MKKDSALTIIGAVSVQIVAYVVSKYQVAPMFNVRVSHTVSPSPFGERPEW